LRGETAVTEYRVVRADGAVRWIKNTLFPISDEHGNVGRVGGVAQDVTRHDGPLVYVVDGDRMDPSIVITHKACANNRGRRRRSEASLGA
jgi:hypothetical protein